MRHPSRVSTTAGILGVILLMWGYILTSQDHLVLTTNGTRQTILRSDHPQGFLIGTLACFLGGSLFIGGAVYAHFCLRLARPSSRGPWGFSWLGIIPFCIALLFILAAWLMSLFHN